MIRLLLTLPLLCLSLNASAEIIPVTQDVIDRFDIGFVAVARPTPGTGASVPAVVIRPPDALSRVITRYDGVVSKWHATAGNTVQAGEPLVTLSSPALLDELARWISATEENTRALTSLERDRALLEAGVIAQSRLDDTESRARESQRGLQAVTRRLEAAGLDLGRLETTGRDTWGDYTLVAPATGRIAHQALMVGEMASQGDTLASINRTDNLWVRADVPRRLADRLSSQQSLYVRATGEPLTLKRMDGEFDARSQTIGLLAEFNRPTKLRPGAIVSLTLPESLEGIHIPADAVVHTGNATVVYVRTGEGVEARELDLSPNGSDYIAAGGISAGEEIVIQGAAVIKGMQLGLGSEDS